MTSRDPSSSPDILGPPGDAAYLISSPIKPFAGRQSWVSPAMSMFRTPRKRPRTSLSPGKSSHSIRFDDIILPTSPTLNLNGRQRSSSPSKIQSQSEGNVSPWRIRVTVEAEQEDEMDNGSVARKRLKSATKTTKVPLKDDSGLWEPTPKRRRGRPRKSDIQDANATPKRDTPGRAKGSPGYTPGPVTGSAAQRKRGRPRKSLPDQSVVESVEADPLPPATEMSQQAGSQINLAVDGNSDDDDPDDIWNANLFDYSTDPDPPNPIGFASNRNSPTPSERRQYRQPEPTPKEVTRITEGGPGPTPAKLLSPLRRNDASPENTLHAGHTPRKRRIYPTPTSSSLVDEENPEGQSRPEHNEIRHEETSHPILDPTDEHREFDSIMESEGFSMVSLESLPSARQRAMNASVNTPKGALKPFFDRQSTNGQDRTKPRVSFGSNSMVLEDNPATYHQGQSAIEQPATKELSPSQPSNTSQRENTSLAKQTPATKGSSPKLPPAPAQVGRSSAGTKKRSFPSLARVVRAGIALQGILRRQRRGSTLRSPFNSPGRSGAREESEDLEGPRKRLEHLFSGFGLETQRELRAGLRFGEELAKRQREAEERRKREEEDRAREPPEANIMAETSKASLQAGTPQQRRNDAPSPARLASETTRRHAEWQLEREAVSREIQRANSNRIIVIESDTDTQERPEGDDISEPDEDLSDDGGIGDIWQEEANVSHSHRSSQSFLQEEDRPSKPRRSEIPSPWKRGQNIEPEEDTDALPPVHWETGQGEIPFLGKSRLGRLREEEVDLSALLRAKNSPNTRKYYGYSSPPTNMSQHLPSSANRTPGISKSQLATSSPRAGQISPEQLRVTRTSEAAFDDPYSEQDNQAGESPVRSPTRSPGRPFSRQAGGPETEEDYIASYDSEHELREKEDVTGPPAVISDSPSIHERSTITPLPRRQTSAAPASGSWFRRLSTFTPGWWKTTSPKAEQEAVYQSEEEGDEKEATAGLVELPQPHRTSIRSEVAESPHYPQLPGLQPAETELEHKKSAQRNPLTVSGYFTDDHYVALRRLYRLAKRSPEFFPYYTTPERADIIGDWLWTADGAYGVPVTELQFAIIDRFVDDLAEADIQNGGTGEIGWTEDELHKRLFSIIVGEQIRKDRKARARDEETRSEMDNDRGQTSTKRWYR